MNDRANKLDGSERRKTMRNVMIRTWPPVPETFSIGKTAPATAKDTPASVKRIPAVVKAAPATAKRTFALVAAAFAIAKGAFAIVNGAPATAKGAFAMVTATFAIVKGIFAIAKHVPALAAGIPAIGHGILRPKQSIPASLGFIPNRAERIHAHNAEGSANRHRHFPRVNRPSGDNPMKLLNRNRIDMFGRVINFGEAYRDRFPETTLGGKMFAAVTTAKLRVETLATSSAVGSLAAMGGT